MLARERSPRIAQGDRTDPKARFDHRPAVKVGAGATGAQAVGAQAIGTLALAAIAVGALAIGALAIGRLAIGRARVRRLEIDELVVRRLRVIEQLQSPPNHPIRRALRAGVRTGQMRSDRYHPSDNSSFGPFNSDLTAQH